MHPIIAVVPSYHHKDDTYFVARDHVTAVKDAGGVPFIVPYELEINEVLTEVHGIYLTGGEDIDPVFFHEEPHHNLRDISPVRDKFEISLVQAAYEKQLPIFAVCRGAQIVNVALNGTMYQDIYSQMNRAVLQHEQRAPKYYATHDIYIKKNSLLYHFVKNEKIRVNSRHHQANRSLGVGLIASATASDGIIEAIESNHVPFLLGVQWHPENMAVHGDKIAKRLYEGFIAACKK